MQKFTSTAGPIQTKRVTEAIRHYLWESKGHIEITDLGRHRLTGTTDQPLQSSLDTLAAIHEKYDGIITAKNHKLIIAEVEAATAAIVLPVEDNRTTPEEREARRVLQQAAEREPIAPETTREPVALKIPEGTLCGPDERHIRGDFDRLAEGTQAHEQLENEIITREPIALEKIIERGPKACTDIIPRAKRPGVILIIRVGDFYEVANEDAVILSKLIGMTGKPVPAVVGFPCSQLWRYVDKLIETHEVDVMESDGTIETHKPDSSPPDDWYEEATREPVASNV